MNILAIDSGSEYLSLALQTSFAQHDILEKVGNKQSNYIIDRINTLLLQNNLTVNQINLIAYNQGPGSFTGLRIGLSVALGMALGLEIKLVPIPAFAIFAYAQLGDVLVALDARLNQVYLAGINTTTLDYFIQPQLVNPDKIPYYSNCTLIGNGFNLYHNQLDVRWKELLPSNQDKYPSALNMLALVNSGKYLAKSPNAADLLYLRNKVALDLHEQQQLQIK